MAARFAGTVNRNTEASVTPEESCMNRTQVRKTTVQLVCLVVGVVVFLAASGAAFGQTTGKVIGTVTDQDTGQPLIGAQVVVEGTNLGNVTNQDGYYFINNVPVGIERVTAQYLGYQTTTQEERVLAGQTMTVDFALSSEVVQAEGIVAGSHGRQGRWLERALLECRRGPDDVLHLLQVLELEITQPLPGERCHDTGVQQGRVEGLGQVVGGAHADAADDGVQLESLHRRIPKRGFHNPFRVEYAVINLDALAERFDAGTVVTPELLRERGLVHGTRQPIKVLARGDIAKGLTVRAHKFSGKAAEKIAAVGGSVEVIGATA